MCNKIYGYIIFQDICIIHIIINFLFQETEPKKQKSKVNNGYEIMDAWMSRRKQIFYEDDFVIIKLATRAEIHFICVDTAFLIDNFAPEFSVQAGKLIG